MMLLTNFRWNNANQCRGERSTEERLEANTGQDAVDFWF